MNHNEEVPDSLGGLGDMLPADVLKKLDELLELLHQKNHISQGSIVFNIYGKGSQHIDNQINIGKTHPDPPCLGREKSAGDLPNELATDKAMVLWKKAQDVGWVDENYQPKLSRTQAALLASEMAKRLSVREKWKLFGAFWHQNKMYKYYYQAMNQKQTLDFLDEIKNLFD